MKPITLADVMLLIVCALIVLAVWVLNRAWQQEFEEQQGGGGDEGSS